jgi:glycosyltransferase involved in cell wall biosynthesis
LPTLFQSNTVAAKTSYVPCGVRLPPATVAQAATDRLDLLFTCSWHQNPESFFLRGGLDVLRAFETIQERYPHVRLTLRTGLPKLKPRFRRVLEKCWVRIIDRYLPDEEMDELMRSTHLLVLPAARIHVVSVLRAMAYGQVVVASDGWGFREYVEHNRNGMIVPGRYGKASWMDEETGMMREDYNRMLSSDSRVANGLIETISTLIEDHELRQRLGRQARRDVETRYNMENWNRGLKDALDHAVSAQPANSILCCEDE